MIRLTKDIIFSGIRVDTCGHIVTTSVPRLETTTKEDIDKALARAMKKPCEECKKK